MVRLPHALTRLLSRRLGRASRRRHHGRARQTGGGDCVEGWGIETRELEIGELDGGRAVVEPVET